MKVTLINYTQNPIEAIEEAASTCYNSKPSNGAIMKHCYNSGHHSVLEFADFHFKIEGISRATSHQLVRHRLASFAQRSQRYCKEDGFGYVTPETIAENETINKTYTHLMSTIETFYDLATTMGVPEEDARFILPNACTTEINVKMNLRELIHFMNERLCTCAQWEIREMAILMREEVLKVCPDLKDMLVPKCEQHNDFPYCPESPKRSCGRHKTISELTKN